jgi:hypothetical protein
VTALNRLIRMNRISNYANQLEIFPYIFLRITFRNSSGSRGSRGSSGSR